MRAPARRNARSFCAPIAGVIFALALPAGALAADAAAPLDLAAARAEARAHAPDAAAIETRLHAALRLAGDEARFQRSDPVLSLRDAPGTLIGEPDESDLSASLELTLDPWGAFARGDAAHAQRTRAGLDREAALADLDEAVAIAVARLALAQRTEHRLSRLVELYAVAETAARAELTAGGGNVLDADAAKMDLATARADLAVAHGDRRAAEAALDRLLGRDPAAPLVVADPPDAGAPPPKPDLAALAERDLRVRALEAALHARKAEARARGLEAIPAPTLGVELGSHRTAIPAAAFGGAVPGGVAWTDRELALTLSLPLPVFDRNGRARAEADAAALLAEARLDTARADARARLVAEFAHLRAAAAAWRAVEGIAARLDTDASLLERAVRAGAMSSVARAEALRRLESAGRRADRALYDLRVARARWDRLTAPGASGSAAPRRRGPSTTGTPSPRAR